MTKSMTGYGRSTASGNSLTVTAEVKSVNSRYLDIKYKLPKMAASLEHSLKDQLQQVVSRGKLELTVDIDGEGLRNREISIDWELAETYMDKLKAIRNAFGMRGDITIDTLLAQSSDILLEEKQPELTELPDLVTEAVQGALQLFIEMRSAEGAALAKDIRNRIVGLQSMLQELKALRPQVMLAYKNRVEERINHYVDGGLPENSRLYQEIALLAEKGDITEEIIRLESHVEQLHNNLDKEGPIGRTCDFILQEMQREANTIGSKSTDASISVIVVSMKSELEKIKEQVQNIE
ncbi:YicC/YloC family endoribonuclease [Terribacillus sp. DMT04]|uniref:YicC/YloC family endoribonuclease n=1 Tax=Terribacillus sp. DMT04 TaxID=2850441 RepID=UPI001C2C116C|nr:YicC/YloC family endoribonuclease [Terribacillus sp. DMT04]QXE03045.1 YicC family protein [Terribacillus sp. DMT04]